MLRQGDKVTDKLKPTVLAVTSSPCLSVAPQLLEFFQLSANNGVAPPCYQSEHYNELCMMSWKSVSLIVATMLVADMTTASNLCSRQPIACYVSTNQWAQSPLQELATWVPTAAKWLDALWGSPEDLAAVLSLRVFLPIRLSDFLLSY